MTGGWAGRAVHLEHEITVELPADAVVVVRLQRQRLELGLEVTPDHAGVAHTNASQLSANARGGYFPRDLSPPGDAIVGRDPAVFLLGELVVVPT